MGKTKFTVADDKNYSITSPQSDKFNEWVGNFQWALRKIKQDIYDESEQLVDYIVVSYDVLSVFTAIYKVEPPFASIYKVESMELPKKSTWLAGRFLPEDNSYTVELWVSLDLEPNTIGIGATDCLETFEDKDGPSLLDKLSLGIVSVIHIV